MKSKKLLVICLSLFFVVAVNAQFEKGNHVGNIGLGLGNALYGSGYKSSVPPISLSYEVGVKDGIFDKGTLGLGGYFGYAAAKYDWGGLFGSTAYQIKYSNIIIGVRGSLHYPLVENLDTYAGLMVGYNIVSVTYPSGWNASGYSSLGSGIIIPGFVGARYFFTEKIGAFAELGWGIAYLNLGLTVKFK